MENFVILTIHLRTWAADRYWRSLLGVLCVSPWPQFLGHWAHLTVLGSLASLLGLLSSAFLSASCAGSQSPVSHLQTAASIKTTSKLNYPSFFFPYTCGQQGHFKQKWTAFAFGSLRRGLHKLCSSQPFCTHWFRSPHHYSSSGSCCTHSTCFFPNSSFQFCWVGSPWG